MRLFFGLEPEPACKAAVADWRDRFGRCDGRPVPAGNFHVTLAFLGNVPEREVETLCEAVDVLGSATLPGPFSLVFDRVGFWPSPGIFWLGPTADHADADKLASRLQKLGQRVGARRDRRTFTPHVTLFRACGSPPPPPVVLPAIEANFDAFILFESRQERHGVHYEALAEWTLAA